MDDFVEQTLGNDALQRLMRMDRGGSSNEKGNRLEDRYATYKIIDSFLKIYTEEPTLELAHQEKGFVDDIVIKYPALSLKVNYQAKDKQQISWNELEANFKCQYVVDTGYHRYKHSKTIALIAPKEQYTKLSTSIPHSISNHTECEHFPNDESFSRIILDFPPLREALKNVVRKHNDDSHLETAFAQILGQWKVSRSSLVKDIWDNVIANAKPKLFVKPPHIPALEISDRLRRILDTAEKVRYDLSDEALSIDICGFTYEISVYDDDYKEKILMLEKRRPKSPSDFIELWEGMK
ncbi:hypothetical protein [Salinivibrio kushneri]|uniref:hypothetical protein n=1 Tax=Salinivibrio kushneri TaxID=1908198 RepID=UPI000986EBB4|nr:hypothetical protein [Salinivibrio kushneri]OOE58781.1 hypothetical protein BZG18_14360 [Salinivibrio kushneri]